MYYVLGIFILLTVIGHYSTITFPRVYQLQLCSITDSHNSKESGPIS